MITHIKGMNKQWKGAIGLTDSKALGILDTDHHQGVAHLLENRIMLDPSPSIGTAERSNMTKLETELMGGQVTMETHLLGMALLTSSSSFGKKPSFSYFELSVLLLNMMYLV